MRRSEEARAPGSAWIAMHKKVAAAPSAKSLVRSEEAVSAADDVGPAGLASSNGDIHTVHVR